MEQIWGFLLIKSYGELYVVDIAYGQKFENLVETQKCVDMDLQYPAKLLICMLILYKLVNIG